MEEFRDVRHSQERAGRVRRPALVCFRDVSRRCDHLQNHDSPWLQTREYLASNGTQVNFFLGWTLIGWVVALAMAIRSVPAR